MNIQTLIGFLGFYFLLIFSGRASDLEIADSLFLNQEYTSAFRIYDSLYTEGQASEAMVLKMAMISEGSGDFPKALFYLSQFQRLHGGEEVEKKIQEIATEHELEGYDYGDLAFIQKTFFDYFNLIVSVVFLGTLFFGSVLAFRVFSRKDKSASDLLMALLFGVGLYVLIFVKNDRPHEGIVMIPKGYLMEGPAAGSEVIEEVKPGEKFRVMGRTDYWLEVERGEKKGYLRANQVWEIN